MLSNLLVLAAMAALAEVSPKETDRVSGSGFETLFPDWRTLNREALAREPEALSLGPGPSGQTVGEAESLGERVGRIVAEGDCLEGERIAREAGDFALVEAVRSHCRVGGN